MALWVALVTPLAGGPPAWGLGALDGADVQKAAIKCQGVIAKTTAKALAAKLKAFNACAGAALACVQTSSGETGCPAKAAATCTKKLAGAAATALKAQAKIIANKSCLALETPALLGAEGLGFGDVAGRCAADFGLDVCEGLEPLAACLVGVHDGAAGPLVGSAAPRAGELLASLPGAPLAGVSGLPTVGGCGSCSADAAARKPVEKCAKTLNGAGQALASALDASFAKCALALYGCVQGEGEAPECIAKATAACTKEATKVGKAVAKLEAAAIKGCAGDFAAASAASGLNLSGLASRCAALGVPALTGAPALSACLAAESRCAIADLVRSALPRTAEFAAAAQLGGLAADLGATCPAASALVTTTSSRGAAVRRGIFGSMLKLVKSVKRAVPLGVGVKTNGGKPASSGGNGTGISKVKGAPRVKFGSINKYKVTYHGARGRIGGGSSPLAPPPSLVVAISRADIVLDDHFEIPLVDLPGDGSDVEDEIEIEFSDTIPACAFSLDFATKADGAVSDYASILQVLDDTLPPAVPVELVTRGPTNGQQDGPAEGEVAISANGRYVAFVSAATNLVTPADTNGFSDVYVRDRCVADGVAVDACLPTTTIESVNPGNQPPHSGMAGHVGISDDGRWVAFDALIDSGQPPIRSVGYVKDRCVSNGAPVDACTVVLTDVTYDLETSSNGGTLTDFSSDGRYAVFASDSIFGGPGILDVYVLDHCVSTTGPVEPGCEELLDRVSEGYAGGPADRNSADGVVSRGGRFVAFRSFATDLLEPGTDLNDSNDVFLRDRCVDPLTGLRIELCTPATERINVGPGDVESAGEDPLLASFGNLALSDDGRFVAFVSSATDLLGAGLDTNGKQDVFVRDRCVSEGVLVDPCQPSIERVNVGPSGDASNGDLFSSHPIAMSADARIVTFATDATNMAGPAVGTPNGTVQVYQRDRCLAAGVPIPGCTPATTLVSGAPDKGLGTGVSDRPVVAAFGSATAFMSTAPNLLGPGVDKNGVSDVFVRDR